MASFQFLSHLIEQYGLYAVFFLVMIEGDVTLLLAGVLAHSAYFADSALGSFARVLWWGTLGGVASDNCAYFAGRAFGQTVRNFRFYRSSKERLQRLTNRFGTLSIFLSKYIYGLRWASCTFYGAAHMPYVRFLLLSAASCFVWVLILSGAGFFFSSFVLGVLVDFRRVGKVLLAIVTVVVLLVYLRKRQTLSKKVEEVEPEKLQHLEQVAIEGLKELKEEIREKIHRSKID